MSGGQELEIEEGGRRYEVVIVPASPSSWVAVIYGDRVFVRDAGDEKLSLEVARAFVRRLSTADTA